jgi:hypothetical protein
MTATIITITKVSTLKHISKWWSYQTINARPSLRKTDSIWNQHPKVSPFQGHPPHYSCENNFNIFSSQFSPICTPCSGQSSILPCPSLTGSWPYIGYYQSCFPIGKDWTLCPAVCTCSSPSGTPTHCYTCTISLPLLASYWLLDSTLSYIPCPYLCPFPSTIHFTLKIEAKQWHPIRTLHGITA